MDARTLAALSTVLWLSACSTKSEAAPPPAGGSAASTKTPPAVAAETPAASGPLKFSAQSGWTVEQPTSSMRKAQYLLPRAEKDTEDASLVVFFFGGQGGSAQANIDRWAQQFEQPDGRESSEVLTNSMRTVNGKSVHDIDLSGTYVAETTPGSGTRLRKEGWRMLAAIVEAKEGPYFVKLIGPAATVKHWEASFRNFVSEMKPGK
jgi:hypothetical protein